jgi:hypothetical protein
VSTWRTLQGCAVARLVPAAIRSRYTFRKEIEIADLFNSPWTFIRKRVLLYIHMESRLLACAHISIVHELRKPFAQAGRTTKNRRKAVSMLGRRDFPTAGATFQFIFSRLKPQLEQMLYDDPEIAFEVNFDLRVHVFELLREIFPIHGARLLEPKHCGLLEHPSRKVLIAGDLLLFTSRQHDLNLSRYPAESSETARTSLFAAFPRATK